MPAASPERLAVGVEVGSAVRLSGAMRKPPSDSFPDPGAACVAMRSRQPVSASS
jgi:hypothetical protein